MLKRMQKFKGACLTSHDTRRSGLCFLLDSQAKVTYLKVPWFLPCIPGSRLAGDSLCSLANEFQPQEPQERGCFDDFLLTSFFADERTTRSGVFD